MTPNQKILSGGIVILLCAALIGGTYRYSSLKSAAEENFKSGVIDTLKVHAPALRDALLKDNKAVTPGEMEILASLARDERMASICYLDRRGTVRWHKEARFVGMAWNDLNKQQPRTDAMAQAYIAKVPRIRMVEDGPLYEIAIPFLVKGKIIGAIDVLVVRPA